jgi:hypothetical protein
VEVLYDDATASIQQLIECIRKAVDKKAECLSVELELNFVIGEKR